MIDWVWALKGTRGNENEWRHDDDRGRSSSGSNLPHQPWSRIAKVFLNPDLQKKNLLQSRIFLSHSMPILLSWVTSVTTLLWSNDCHTFSLTPQIDPCIMILYTKWRAETVIYRRWWNLLHYIFNALELQPTGPMHMIIHTSIYFFFDNAA